MTRRPKTVADLTGDPGNPRVWPPEQLALLAEAMRRFGDLSGIVYNRTTGNLVGGHQRNRALPESASIEIDGQRRRTPNDQGTVAVGWIMLDGERWRYREVKVDLETEQAMNLAANKFGEQMWDYDKLAAKLGVFSGSADATLSGFTAAEIEALLVTDFEKLPGSDREVHVVSVVVGNVRHDHAPAVIAAIAAELDKLDGDYSVKGY